MVPSRITIDGKNQPIGCYIKQYKEIKKLRTKQGKDYTTRCFLHHNYTKNSYKLITVDLC